MIRFSFVTLFPQVIEGYFSAGILARSLESEKIAIDFYNPRDYTTDKFQRVDATMTGGGAGMLMTPQPLFDTLSHIKDLHSDAHIVFLTPVGKTFKQNDAQRLARLHRHIVLVCGRYEGIDERVIEVFADEVMSLGDFILSGGELAAMCVCDAVSRNVAGVLGNEESLEVESFENGLLEAPSFTKPHEYEGYRGISEYIKGNHSKISDLKTELALCKTQFHRPDLYQKVKR